MLLLDSVWLVVVLCFMVFWNRFLNSCWMCLELVVVVGSVFVIFSVVYLVLMDCYVFFVVVFIEMLLVGFNMVWFCEIVSMLWMICFICLCVLVIVLKCLVLFVFCVVWRWVLVTFSGLWRLWLIILFMGFMVGVYVILGNLFVF